MDQAQPQTGTPVNTVLYQLAEAKLAEAKLGQNLGLFIVDRYDGNEHTHNKRQQVFPPGPCTFKHPHYKVAGELTALTGVDISHEAVRKWYTTLTGRQSRRPADSIRARQQQAA